jgi:hypothetical protein
MDVEKNFIPSDAFLSFLGTSSPATKYFAIPALEPYTNKERKDMSLNLYTAVMPTDHDLQILGLDASQSKQWCQGGLEMIKNSLDHGPVQSPTSLAKYLGPKGIGYAVYDRGDFYKQSHNKQYIDTRKIPPASPRGTGAIGWSGGNHGFAKLYSLSQYREVDTHKGILWWGFSKTFISQFNTP